MTTIVTITEPEITVTPTEEIVTVNITEQVTAVTIASGVRTLANLSDVAITTPTDDQVLTYDDVTGKWVNQSVAVVVVADVTDLTTLTGNAGEWVRVKVGGGLEYRTSIQALSDIGAETAGAAAAVQTNLNTHTGDLANPHVVTPTQLGLVIGTNVQAFDQNLADIAGLVPGVGTDGYSITWDNTAGAFVLTEVTGGGGGTPGGSNTQLQFNNASAFGGADRLTWDDSGKILTLSDGTTAEYPTQVPTFQVINTHTASINGSTYPRQLVSELTMNPSVAETQIGHPAAGYFLTETHPDNAQNYTITSVPKLKDANIIGLQVNAHHKGSGSVDSQSALRLRSNNEGAGTLINNAGLVVVSGKNVGAGTLTNDYGIFIDYTDPAGASNYPLYVLNGGSGAFRGITSAIVDDTSNAPAVGLYKARGTFEARTAVIAGDVVGNVFPIVRTPAGLDLATARFGWQVRGTPSGNNVQQDFVLDLPDSSGNQANMLRVFGGTGYLGVGRSKWTTAVVAETGIHMAGLGLGGRMTIETTAGSRKMRFGYKDTGVYEVLFDVTAGLDRAVMDTSGNLAIGTTTISGKTHINQASATAAIPVLTLTQADVSEQMMTLACTAGVGNAIELVGAKTLTVTEFIKVTINGNTRYVAAGTIS